MLKPLSFLVPGHAVDFGIVFAEIEMVFENEFQVFFQLLFNFLFASTLVPIVNYGLD